MKRLDDAIDQHKEALAIYRRLEVPEGQAACLANLGIIAEERNNIDEALSYFREGLQLARESCSRHDECNLLIRFGRVLRERGERSDAKENFIEARKLAHRCGFYDFEAAANTCLDEMEEAGG